MIHGFGFIILFIILKLHIYLLFLFGFILFSENQLDHQVEHFKLHHEDFFMKKNWYQQSTTEFNLVQFIETGVRYPEFFLESTAGHQVK